MEILWKKKSDAVDALYVDLFGDKISTKMKFMPKKSNKMSTKLRNEGNVWFRLKNYATAIRKYNESLRFAENGSVNVGLAYANRAACFFHSKMYEQCLMDIELAKKANYPVRLMPKLEKRKADCMALMKTRHQFKVDALKLSYEADEKFPGMANVLEIKENDKFGRHIVAKCDIPAGEVVLMEGFFPSTTTKGMLDNCIVCGNFDSNLIACPHCTGAMFCNEECMKEGIFHAIECGIAYDDELGVYIQFISTLIGYSIDAFESVEELMELIEEVVINNPGKEMPISTADFKSKFRLLLKYEIDCDIDEAVMKEAAKVYHTLWSFPLVKKSFNSKKKQRFLMHLTSHLLRIIKQTVDQDVNEENQHIQTTYGFLFIRPLFNHQCAPNVHAFKSDQNNSKIGIIQRPVKKGEQLFVSYICSCCHGYESTDIRREYLHKKYEFWCECDMCKPMKQSSSRLQSMQLDSNFQFINQKSLEGVDNDNVKQIIELRKKCIEFLNVFGRSPFTKELDLVLAAFNFTNKDLFE